MKKILSTILAIAMAFILPLTAFAATSGDVDVYGHIGVGSLDPTLQVDVTFDTTVHWWVTPASYASTPNVLDGDSSGPTTAMPNQIVNNSAADMNVSFISFVGTNTDAATVASNLTLFLTGDLGADGMNSNDLAGDYSLATPYTALLTSSGTATDTWNYGFEGQYLAPGGTLSGVSLTPQYQLTLEFSF